MGRVPSIPATTLVQDPHTRAVLDALREVVSAREGNGDPMARSITLRDLINMGVIDNATKLAKPVEQIIVAGGGTSTGDGTTTIPDGSITAPKLSDGSVTQRAIVSATGGCVPIEPHVQRHTHYFAAGWAVTPRTGLPEPDTTTIVADGAQAATWSGLPAGANVVVSGPVSGAAVVGASGVFALDVDTAGTYTVRIDCHPFYVPGVWEIVAT